MIRECAFSFGICHVSSVFQNSVTGKSSPETIQAASVNEFSTINGQYFLDLSEFSFPSGNSTGSLTERFKNSGYNGWVPQTGAIRIRRGTQSCFNFRSTEIILKEGNAYGRPVFQFCFITSIPGLYGSGCWAYILRH